jgi:hypothetical protein
MLIAEFYRGSKSQPSVLQLNDITEGRRTQLHTLPCADKREARKLAASHGAEPWNF